MNEAKNIIDLGNIDGKLLFFGGVYSNLQALQSLKKWADENDYKPANIFCTGDIVGYCAQPVECIDLIREWNIYAIAGNVELQVRSDADDCGCDFKTAGRCDLFSKNWYNYIRSTMNTGAKEWLHTLPHHIKFYYGNRNVALVHGSWFHTADFIFKSTLWSTKQENFEASNTNVIVAGHCGLPFKDQQEDYTWLNPGVIGMPANDGSTKVWFATSDYVNGNIAFEFHHLEYDHQTARMLMIENNLPVSYAQTLTTGIWDNCEILPEVETIMQGKKIVF